VIYLFPGRLKMKEFTLKDYLDFTFYWWGESLKQDLDMHRNGICYVESLKGMRLSSLDLKIAKGMQDAVQSHLTIQIRKILVVDPGLILKACMKIAKVFVKKKIMDRVELCKRTDLVNFIAEDHLIKEFGGNLDI